MYLKDSNKKLKEFEEFENLFNIANKDMGNFNISFRLFKYFIIEMLDNMSEVGDYKYSISEKEINSIANKLVGNNDIWETIDFAIIEELKKFERK